MVRVYYHIYSLDGIELIVDEHMDLLEKYFNFPFVTNFGIGLGQENKSNSKLIEKTINNKKLNPVLRDVRINGNEFTTLDSIYKDKDFFDDNDKIFYFHSKGISRIKSGSLGQNIIDWRNFMNYFCIEKVKDVFSIFERTNFNTYGVNLRNPSAATELLHYSGNFWWAKGSYLKTLDNKKYDVLNRLHAETHFLQSGQNWRPYSAKESEVNHYYFEYKKENYR